MSSMKIKKRYFTTAGLIWAACFIVFLLAYMLVLGPQRKYEKRIESKIAEKKQAYESALRASEGEAKLQLNNQIKGLQSRLNDFVINFEDSANLTFDISQIANEKNVTSFSIKNKDNRGMTKKSELKYIRESQIDISFTGGFNQFATFMSALERHRPVLFIDKFTIIRARQEDLGYQVSMNVTAFVTKQQNGMNTDKGLAQVYGNKI